VEFLSRTHSRDVIMFVNKNNNAYSRTLMAQEKNKAMRVNEVSTQL